MLRTQATELIVKRGIFQVTTFSKNSVPDYECPKCGAHLKQGDLIEFASAYTKDSRKHNPDHDQDHEMGVFHASLECTRPSCGETIVVVGRTREDEIYAEGEDGYDREYVTYCTPQYFIPPLEIFKIPGATPHSVKESIMASFNLFFVSSGSALNEIRNAIEFLMDELKVPRKGLDANGVEERWDLDKRVGKMPNQDVNVKAHLLAIKNLGNWGSHAVDTDRNDVLDAYDLLSHVLEALYVKRDKAMQELAKRIKEDERAK